MLNKMDMYLLENIKRLERTGYKDKNPRAKYKSDGAPANAISIRGGVYEIFDLQAGEFPLTFTRFLPVKTFIGEMLAIFQSQTNTQEGFESHNCYWWADWCNEEGNIGRAYSYNMESHRPNEMTRNIVAVKKKIFTNNEHLPVDIGLVHPLKESVDGQIYSSEYREYGDYIITKYYTKQDTTGIKKMNRKYAEVQFLSTGYITHVRLDSLERGQHPKNNFVRTLAGIGYLGDLENVKNFSKTELSNLKKIWSGMINRCYNGEKKDYDDVFVHARWHSFANFLRDVRFLPQYHLAKEAGFKGYNLDKDFYGSNLYSAESCVFLSIKDNTTYRSQQKPPVSFESETNKFVFLSYSDAASFFKVSKGTISRWVKKGSALHNEVEYSIVEESLIPEHLFRYELSRNQLNSLLYNLKHDPSSRRHIISFWHWSNIDKKMLVECAYETQWTVANINGVNYLDLTLIQRSSDYLVAGTGINQAQYVALQMMVAKHCGYEVGIFEHYRKNVHVYDRHLGQLNETINRLTKMKKDDVKREAKLILNVPDGTNFYDITIDDFEIVGYDYMKPQLEKFDLGI